MGEDLSESAFIAEIGIRVASCPGTLKGYLTRLQHTEGHTARLRRAQTCPPHDSSYEKSWSISRRSIVKAIEFIYEPSAIVRQQATDLSETRTAAMRVECN